MRRFFAEKLDISGGEAVLCGDEARHIKNVLRYKTGDEVLLIDGGGAETLAEIVSLGDNEVRLALKESRACPADPEVRVTLFQCLPKQGKMELIIQKCVELGVSEIVPAASKRCVVKLDGKDNKLARWNKVSAEAAKQCGRATVPAVKAPISLDKADLSGFALVLIPYENEGETTLKSVLRGREAPASIAVIIGPEGGFEPAEVEDILNKGGVAVSLGRRILRTETAGMAAVAQIMYELEQ